MKKFYLFILISLTLSLMGSCQLLPNQPLNYGSFFTSDASITDSVKSAFMNNNELSSTNLNVETNHGVVVLSGYVKTIRQSDTAGELATKIPGVKQVENNLIVRK